MASAKEMRGVILDADSLGPGDLDLTPILDTLGDWETFPVTATEDIAGRIAGADVVLTNKIPLNASTLAGADKLKLVSILATGFNHIDLAAAKEKGVVVSNARAYATPSVVQHTIGLMLALTTNLEQYVGAVRDGRWQQSDVFCFLDFPIRELAGKVLGIVGYGELGRGVADVARAFGMEILIAARPGHEAKGERVALTEMLPQVDFLSLHCPLTEETTNLIDADALARMKPTAFLINTARGGLIDADALIDALTNDRIGGAGLDVLPTEPPPAEESLIQAASKRLLITPHSAWGALETRQRLVTQTVEHIEGFLAGKPVRALT